MKKTLALLLTLALSMAALTGCGSKTDAPAADSTDSTTVCRPVRQRVH